MKRIFPLLMGRSLMAWLFLFCVGTASEKTLKAQAGNDALDILSVNFPNGSAVPAGDTFSAVRRNFQVKVHYVLGSVAPATLALYVEEYPSTAGGCTGSQHTTSGAANYSIPQRGSGNPSITVPWLGDTAGYANGYITIGANFFASNNRVFRSFGTFPQYCYSFNSGR